MQMLNSSDGLAPPPAARRTADPGFTPGTAIPRSDDAIVVARSLDEPEIFAAIFDRHAPTVHRYLSRRLGTTEADDLLGEVFLRAFEGRRRFATDADSARPWLLGIATNLISHRHRSEERQYRALARAAHQVEDERFPADRVVAQVDASVAMGALSTALTSLAPGDRDVLLLLAWGDLTYGEIAAALDIPIGTVRSRLSRTRSVLRSLLPPHLLEGTSDE
jgi:RNA polymerase sigma factor (sigma-70 family)